MYSVFKIRGPRRPHDGTELLAPAMPEVGIGMSMYRGDSGRRVCTTEVRRIFRAGERFYAQTHNSLYRLEELSERSRALPRTGNGW